MRHARFLLSPIVDAPGEVRRPLYNQWIMTGPGPETLLRRMFRIAAVYNVAWGLTVALFPNLLFDIFRVPRINYPFIMSGLGMCIGLYGYGYWVVSRELERYPQIVVIGFLGKTIGPVGWLWTVVTTALPLRTMWTNVFNDLIWLPFFIMYLIWYRKLLRRYEISCCRHPRLSISEPRP